MVTTFFGAHSFGGDAAYVDRLARALLGAGHQVDVVYNVDAFELTRGEHPLRTYDAPHGLRLIGLEHPMGTPAALWTHQTSGPGLHSAKLAELFASGDYDVIHLHNISLMGGLGIVDLARRHSDALRLMTAHDHWLTCPLSLLWKFDREVCVEPQCVRCTVAAKRPPQWWRSTSLRQRALAQLDALVVSTEHARLAHSERGVGRDIEVLPYFLPEPMVSAGDQAVAHPGVGQPYFAVAGRLIKEKGFETVIQRMRRFPDVDLLVAGDGPYRDALIHAARDLGNVHFVGLLDYPSLLQLYKGALALVVPSQFYETFGYVVLEAFSTATPVIVNDLGPLPEHVRRSGGGLVYSSPEELDAAMSTLLEDASLRQRLGASGRADLDTRWSEEEHLQAYMELVASAAASR